MRERKTFLGHIKKRYIVFSALFIAVFSWQHTQIRRTSVQFLDGEGKIHILSLPVRDRNRLIGLMEKLFARDGFAYTILGNKPLSWATYQNPFPFTDWSTFYDSLKRYNRTMCKGWKTWEKYQHVFSNNNLWAEKSKCHPGYVSILLINEECFNVVVNDNKSDFQEVLGREVVNGLQLRKEAKVRSLMDEVLKGHQALMGIALGYGRDNSWRFLEMSKKRQPLGCVWNESSDWVPDEGAFPSKTQTEYYMRHYSCPRFAGDPNSEESLILKNHYILTKEKVLNYYEGKDFLEATLSLLAGYRPAES